MIKKKKKKYLPNLKRKSGDDGSFSASPPSLLFHLHAEDDWLSESIWTEVRAAAHAGLARRSRGVGVTVYSMQPAGRTESGRRWCTLGMDWDGFGRVAGWRLTHSTARNPGMISRHASFSFRHGGQSTESSRTPEGGVKWQAGMLQGLVVMGPAWAGPSSFACEGQSCLSPVRFGPFEFALCRRSSHFWKIFHSVLFFSRLSGTLSKI